MSEKVLQTVRFLINLCNIVSWLNFDEKPVDNDLIISSWYIYRVPGEDFDAFVYFTISNRCIYIYTKMIWTKFKCSFPLGKIFMFSNVLAIWNIFHIFKHRFSTTLLLQNIKTWNWYFYLFFKGNFYGPKEKNCIKKYFYGWTDVRNFGWLIIVISHNPFNRLYRLLTIDSIDTSSTSTK